MELNLLGKRVLVDDSPVIERLNVENWRAMFEPLGGLWRAEGGALIGEERGNRGGIALTRRSFEGDVMIRCRIASGLPATRDVNALYNARWDDDTDYLASGYIAGLNGWYDHKAGIEKFPEDGLNATTPLYDYVHGAEVDLVAGAIAGHNFLAVDGRLIMELIDPRPLSGGRVGFSPYCTRLVIRECEVRAVKWEPRRQSYESEF